MSRAFVKESDRPEPLPEIPLSEHPNWTTPAGLVRQQQRLAALRDRANELAVSPDEAAQQAAAREQRWLEARIATAVVIEPAHQPRDRVAFGANVDVVDEHGNESSYRIVGEDEADPKAGSISYVAPVARILMGKAVGDLVTVGDQELEITAIA